MFVSTQHLRNKNDKTTCENKKVAFGKIDFKLNVFVCEQCPFLMVIRLQGRKRGKSSNEHWVDRMKRNDKPRRKMEYDSDLLTDVVAHKGR